MSDQDDCKQCLNGIGRIEGQLSTLNSSIMKIFYALIALAGASVGTKFIGTPWYIELGMYSALFGGIFVFIITIWKWKCLCFAEKWIRLSFVVYVVYTFSLRVYHYNTDTPFTKVEGMFTNIIMTSLAVAFIVLAWRRDSLRRKNRRRHDD